MGNSDLTIKKIWNEAPHNAFTDLARFHGRWLCCFREGTEHEHKSLGKICLIESVDGDAWHLLKRFEKADHDLRDPKLSLTPKGDLLLVFASIAYFDDEKIDTLYSYTVTSPDGKEWSPWTQGMPEGYWLWDLTWHKREAYGLAYQPKEKKKGVITLWKTRDGKGFQEVHAFTFPTAPSEGTVLFQRDDEAVAVLRCDQKRSFCTMIGRSSPPYLSWTWKESRHKFHSPALLELPNEQILTAGRLVQFTPYGIFGVQVLGVVEDELVPFFALPSSGDCGYPGIASSNGTVWMSYYSNHEGKAEVYLAIIDLLGD